MANNQSKEPSGNQKTVDRDPIGEDVRKLTKKLKSRWKFVPWHWMLLFGAFQFVSISVFLWDYFPDWVFGVLCLLSLLLTFGLPARRCGPVETDAQRSFGSKLKRFCSAIGLISWCIAGVLLDVGVFMRATNEKNWVVDWGSISNALQFEFFNVWFQIAILFGCIGISIELLRSSGDPVHEIETKKHFRDKFGTQLSWLMTGFFTLAILSFDPVHRMVEHDKNAIYKIWHEVGLGIFVAAFVSLVFDIAYHDSAFMKHVNKIEESVEGLSGILGYLNFRDRTFRAYETATDRIISINDYWGMDLNWWDNEDWKKQIRSAMLQPDGTSKPMDEILAQTQEYANWEDTNLYYHMALNPSILLKKNEGGEERAPAFPTVIFAGAVPYPQKVEIKTKRSLIAQVLVPAKASEPPSEDLKFSKEDFRRFLGVMWRIVLAHKLRTAVRDNEGADHFEVPISVLAATVPIMTTVVDDLVWLLIVPAGSDERNRKHTVFDARGIHVSEEISSAMQNRTGSSNYAAAVTEMVMSYLRGAHSAREYVQSILVLAMNMADKKGLNVNLRPNQLVDPIGMYDALEMLGLNDWAEWEVQQSNGRNTTGYGTDLIALKVQALEIADQFVKTLKSVPNIPASGTTLKEIQDALF